MPNKFSETDPFMPNFLAVPQLVFVLPAVKEAKVNLQMYNKEQLPGGLHLTCRNHHHYGMKGTKYLIGRVH